MTRKDAPGAGSGPSAPADGQYDLTGWHDPFARMRAALDNDELELFAQRIEPLAPGSPAGLAEVLVRMREEEQKLLPPGDFLPAFEHYRMMPALDRWVVRHSLACLAAPGEGRYRILSVNVSGQTLEDADFPPYVAAELMRSAVPAGGIGFEIDEIDTLTRLEQAARFSEAVRRAGCLVLIDGFGRRSVTFQALIALRPDFVKIDGVIVRHLLASQTARNKLMAILRFCRINSVKPIAESVESDEVLEAVREAGIGLAQGFGIARPGPIERPGN